MTRKVFVPWTTNVKPESWSECWAVTTSESQIRTEQLTMGPKINEDVDIDKTLEASRISTATNPSNAPLTIPFCSFNVVWWHPPTILLKNVVIVACCWSTNWRTQSRKSMSSGVLHTIPPTPFNTIPQFRDDRSTSWRWSWWVTWPASSRTRRGLIDDPRDKSSCCLLAGCTVPW